MLVQLVNLTDEAVVDQAPAAPDGSVRCWRVASTQVGRFLADAVESSSYVGSTVALS